MYELSAYCCCGEITLISMTLDKMQIPTRKITKITFERGTSASASAKANYSIKVIGSTEPNAEQRN